ncbi:MAG: aldolase/citrate lyase family protein, partial [Gammaproteobacteria bacterium]
VVRPPWNDTIAFKGLLDVGVQNFLVPFVQTAEEARRAVAATRYPPRGVRGGAVATRANRCGRTTDYLRRANDEICIHVQLETRAALENLEAIAAVDGVDGLFIGPSDLAADMGHLGNSAHPAVRAAIDHAVVRIRKTGKAAGALGAAGFAGYRSTLACFLELFDRLEGALRALPHVQLLPAPVQRTPTLTFTVTGTSPRQVAAQLARR